MWLVPYYQFIRCLKSFAFFRPASLRSRMRCCTEVQTWCLRKRLHSTVFALHRCFFCCLCEICLPFGCPPSGLFNSVHCKLCSVSFANCGNFSSKCRRMHPTKPPSIHVSASKNFCVPTTSTALNMRTDGRTYCTDTVIGGAYDKYDASKNRRCPCPCPCRCTDFLCFARQLVHPATSDANTLGDGMCRTPPCRYRCSASCSSRS